jgi:hypothetical protein
MLKSRITIHIDFNIYNTIGNSDELLNRVITSKCWEEIDKLHTTGALNVGEYVKSNQYQVCLSETIC